MPARPDGTGLTDEEFFALDAWERSMAIARSTPPIAASPSSLPAVDDDGSSPVITAFPSDAIEEGIVSGTLMESDGCLYVVEAGRISLLVLPAGTGWDATSSSVINSDGTSASVGEAVIASGGSHPVSDLTPYYLDDEYPEAVRCAEAAGTDVVQTAGRLERAG